MYLLSQSHSLGESKYKNASAGSNSIRFVSANSYKVMENCTESSSLIFWSIF